jgi:flagellar basal body rod protein FlgC
MMPPDIETNEAEVSGVMSDSENEYDETEPRLKEDDDDDDDGKMADSSVTESVDANGEVKKKYDPKDPMRPRRKKARRACFACQRAHLTCGMHHVSS